MSNEIVPSQAIKAFSMPEDELISVLESSLYPGASSNSIKLVINYCRAAMLDPLQKPVHIVPIWDSKARSNRDVIMPGIGLYRTQAARTGNYAGVSEPEFGQEVTENLGGVNVTYPVSCKVTVKRILPNGATVEFSAVERWKENYATKGGAEKSIAPNAMWARRPFAQLAKCAEAQALRKAFPEFGAQPTADELEGQEYFVEKEINPQPEPIKQPQPKKAAESAAKPAEQRKTTVIDNDTGEIIETPTPAQRQPKQESHGEPYNATEKPAPAQQAKPEAPDQQPAQQPAKPAQQTQAAPASPSAPAQLVTAGMISYIKTQVAKRECEYLEKGGNEKDFVMTRLLDEFKVDSIEQLLSLQANDAIKFIKALEI